MAVTPAIFYKKVAPKNLFSAVPRLTPINGEAATVAIGTVTTLPAGSEATVENVGTPNAAVLDFGLPRGEVGPIESIVAGTGVTVDDTDPANPIVSSVASPDIASQEEAEEQDDALANNTKMITPLRLLQGVRAGIREHGFITALMFGAKGDGTTDDTAAWEDVAAFINDGDGGVKVRDPGRPYYMTGGIEFAQQVDFEGAGSATRFIIADSHAGGAQFTLKPVLGAEFSLWRFGGLFIDAETDGNGDDGIVFDTSAHADVSLSRGDFGNIRIGTPLTISTQRTIGGYGIQHIGHASDANGMFTSHLHDLFVQGGLGGLYMDKWGDSNVVNRLWTKGPGRGLYVNLVSGAACLAVRDMNSTSHGGAIHLVGGYRTTIENSHAELLDDWDGSATREEQAMVVLDDCSQTTIEKCSWNPELGSGDAADAISLMGTTERTLIRSTRMICDSSAGYYHINQESTVTRTILEGGNFYNNPLNTLVSAPVYNSGAALDGIYGVWRQLTLLNSWAALSTGGAVNEGLFLKIAHENEIHLKGNIGGGTNTAGTVIASLPTRARPTKTKRLTVLYINSGNWGSWIITLGTNGDLTVAAQVLPATTALSFDMVVYNTD